jgi:DnaK suppressor protein
MEYNDIFNSEDPRLSIQKTLLSRKLEIEKTLKDMMAYHRENKELLFGDDIREDADRAEKEISAQTYYTLLERKNQELKRLENLLEHISQNEEFGICEDCGEEIGYKRLLAMPEVTRCIDCQRDFEKDWARDNNRMRYPVNNRKQAKLDTDDSSEDFDALAIKHGIDKFSNDDFNEIELEFIALENQNNRKPPFLDKRS